jgi:hypothetical protein
LAIRDLTKPLVGKQVFEWIQTQDFFNQCTNNINIPCANKQVKVDDSLANSKTTKNAYTSLQDGKDAVDPPLNHVCVKDGYNFGVLKSYKEMQ